MDDGARAAALEAATRLGPELGDGLRFEVEAALVGQDGDPASERFGDIVAIGALIVAAAQLAWTIWSSRANDVEAAAREHVERRIRLELPATGLDVERRDQIIAVVVEETLRVRR